MAKDGYTEHFSFLKSKTAKITVCFGFKILLSEQISLLQLAFMLFLMSVLHCDVDYHHSQQAVAGTLCCINKDE